MAKTLVVDSDSIFALYNPNDSLNEKATRTFQQLIAQNYKLIYPASVLFEIISLFQRVMPTPKVTTQLVNLIKDNAILVHIIDADILKKAVLLFNPAGSRKNTLIDCSVVAVAKKIKADGVFAYDSFYAKHGLKSAEQLLGKRK